MTAPPDSSYRTIPLTRGKFAVVDAPYYEHLAQFKWTALRGRKTFYAYRSVRRSDGRRTAVSMHRAILGFDYGDEREIDHQDGDGLNNRRANLRVASYCENSRNRSKRIDNTSGFKGVYVDKRGKYVARITASVGKRVFLGLFDDGESAYAAYCEAAKRIHGEFANLG